jgi:hypothetical protein
MTIITTTWRQLVRRRLWPVALLLVAALAAIPVLLAQEPEVPAPPAGVPVVTEADDTIAEPVVAEVTPEDRARRRRVLGVRKDPFKPAPVKQAKVDEPKPQTPPKADGTGTGASPVQGGGGVTPPGEPATPKKYYEAGTIVVRFGPATTGGELQKLAIPKFGAVPDEELPLLVYMGLTNGGKKAKFLVDASVEVDGDGDCKPHPGNCETIELAVGETTFLDVLKDYTEEGSADEDDVPTDETEETEEEAEPEILATFQLDLVDIKRAGDDDVR